MLPLALFHTLSISYKIKIHNMIFQNLSKLLSVHKMVLVSLNKLSLNLSNPKSCKKNSKKLASAFNKTPPTDPINKKKISEITKT